VLEKMQEFQTRLNKGDLTYTKYQEEVGKIRAKLPPHLKLTEDFRPIVSPFKMYKADQFIKNFKDFDLDSGEFQTPVGKPQMMKVSEMFTYLTNK
jgi:hypothetical protein